METPLVSVLMIAYNSSRFIREAVESVMRQTYAHFELIIIDDRSADNTWEIVAEFKDERIRRFRNDINLGEYRNRNKAVDLANGEYLIFIDADDIIYPYGLQFMMQFARTAGDCGLIISRPWDERIIYPAKLTPHQLYCFEYLDKGAIGINFTKVLFKSSVIKAVGVFPDRVKLGDVYIQYLIGRKHCALLIPDASTWWRRTLGQASGLLLKNYSEFLKHDMWIKLDMLNHPECPLSESERKAALHNLYGNYGRFLVKRSIRFRIGDVITLLRMYPIPRKFISSLFKKQDRTYFNRYSGNRPLSTNYVL